MFRPSQLEAPMQSPLHIFTALAHPKILLQSTLQGLGTCRECLERSARLISYSPELRQPWGTGRLSPGSATPSTCLVSPSWAAEAASAKLFTDGCAASGRSLCPELACGFAAAKK